MMLSYRWTDLCEHFKIPSEKKDLILKIILERYSRPGRYYHTPKHIKHCLEELEPLKEMGLGIDMPVIEMAIWFHDFHEPYEQHHELKSIQHFQGITRGLIDPLISQEIVKCIMVTKHNRETFGQNSEYMADIDLASLGYEREWIPAITIQCSKCGSKNNQTIEGMGKGHVVFASDNPHNQDRNYIIKLFQQFKTLFFCNSKDDNKVIDKLDK